MRVFLGYVKYLADTMVEVRTKSITGFLAVDILRRLSGKVVEESNGAPLPQYARLHRGMILASRIATISSAPHCHTKNKGFLVSEKIPGI